MWCRWIHPSCLELGSRLQNILVISNCNISLLIDFCIIRVVSMDPSQLFGAWLDNRTFLGGCLEISLDRFTTTVQIEAFDVRIEINLNVFNVIFRTLIF